MLAFKKFYCDELLQLALLLSLLRIDIDLYLNISNRNFGLEQQEIGIGPSSAYIQSYIHNLHNRLNGYNVHPKSVESIFLNQQSLFYELNLLGRYQNAYEINRPNEFATYLLSEEQDRHDNSSDDTASVPQLPDDNHRNDTNQTVTSLSTQEVLTTEDPSTNLENTSQAANLTKEDMDLIEVLLRQDIDLGVTRELFDSQLRKEVEKFPEQKETPPEATASAEDLSTSNPWAGLNYTIDSETGEHVVQDENDETPSLSDRSSASPLQEDDLLSLAAEFENIPLEETLQLAQFDTNSTPQEDLKNQSPSSGVISEEEDLFSAVPPQFLDREVAEQLEQFEDMIQATNQLQVEPHQRPSRGIPYFRTNSLEQRWQDLANILSLPDVDSQNTAAMISAPTQNMYLPGNNNSYGGILLNNASLAPPMGDINSNISTFPSELAAVGTSLNTLTNSSDPMGETQTPQYLGDEGSLIYPSNHSELNQTTDGFLSSILNDEDMQLMDLAEGTFNGTDRFMQNNQTLTGIFPVNLEQADIMDNSSDSAVSSMGSTERMGSFSDGVSYCRNSSEWMETGSNSSSNDGYKRSFNSMDYSPTASKQRAYDCSYPPQTLRPPIAQKKYHLYGKRLSTDNTEDLYRSNRNSNANGQSGEIKYSDCMYNEQRRGRRSFDMIEGATAIEIPEQKFSCSMEFFRQHNPSQAQLGQIQHNHTYQLPSESVTSPQRPVSRDKLKRREDDHLSRDERRARSMKLPLTTSEIIELPMDEFNERISKYDLTEPQLALIRDIRRRGKNKVAAQNCRKRKLDQILTLAEVVQELQQNNDDVVQEHQELLAQKQSLQEKYNHLYMHVFQTMRDSHGNALPFDEFSLQQAANGSMILVPRNNGQSNNNNNNNNMEVDRTSGARAKKKDNNNKK